ncbi:MAG: amidohydrolase [Gammaproteobacteria bacterium]|nr:amidohydrolase [Gammaproteobacteria bacterium]MYF38419.1 amidohydrolase [Gammaproteobacteria bacterium]
MPRQNVEKIVWGDYVVTMDEARQVITNGGVAIDQGRLVAVGSEHDLRRQFTTQIEFLGKDKVLLPGLINGHTHAAMTLLRGYSDDVPLMEWLNEHINPIEAAVVNEEFVQVGTQLACWEMIRGGTTTFVDMYFFHDVAAKVVDEIGLRALISATVVDQPRNDAKDIEEQWQQAKTFIENWSSTRSSSTVKPILGGHAIYTLKREHLIELHKLGVEYGVPVHIHIAESQFEKNFSETTYDAAPVEFLDSIDFFTPHVIAAHVIWTTKHEVDILAKRGVGVIHNPTSNSKIASGIAPIAEYLDAGVIVGLGTDGAATNNDLDLWEEMRLAAYLQKVTTMDPTVLPARVVLEMATRRGADAIGLGSEIGTLREGMRADLIQVGLKNAHQLPMYDIESHLVNATHASDVQTVFVDGVCLFNNGEFLTFDPESVSRNVSQVSDTIRCRQRVLN